MSTDPSAFPLQADPELLGQPEWGMTLREWYAGKALPSALTETFARAASRKGIDVSVFEMAASAAWGVADAMMAEREKRETK